MKITRRDMLQRLAVLTGSVAFGVGTRHSDEDWLIGENEARELGIDTNALNSAYNGYLESFCTYREGRINLIIWKTKAFRDRWMKAHRHCLIERPKKKSRRIKIFRHYLYGELLA